MNDLDDKPLMLAIPAKADAPGDAACASGPLWLLPWLGLAGWFLVSDFAIAPCADQWGPHEWGAMFVYGSAGPLLAQFAILPAWLVLGSPAYWLRLMLVWSAALVAYGAWWLGFAATGWIDGISDSDARHALALLLLLPAVSLAIEAPLWLLRLGFGWRIARPSHELPAHHKLSIRDMLLATTLVACALAAARIAARLVGDSDADEAGFWQTLGISVISLGGGSAVLLAPILWLALRVERTALAVAAAVAHILVLGAIWMSAAILLEWVPDRGAWGYLGVTVTTVSFAACVSAPFWLARLQGYRLVRPDSAAS